MEYNEDLCSVDTCMQSDLQLTTLQWYVYVLQSAENYTKLCMSYLTENQAIQVRAIK